MAADCPNPQGSRYTHNDTAFVEYNTRLQSNNLPTFAGAASKFTEWLGSDKAYYPNARVPVRLPPRTPPPRAYPLSSSLRSDRLNRRGMPIIRQSYLSFPDKTVIESAHANICRVQGDPSVPFTLGKALPGLDPWYQPYFSLLKQVGSHLNHFEPELRGNPSLIRQGLTNGTHHLARLQSLVENAGIQIVQIPTLTEKIGPQPRPSPPTEREFIPCSASPSPATPPQVATTIQRPRVSGINPLPRMLRPRPQVRTTISTSPEPLHLRQTPNPRKRVDEG